jgi:ParB family chromosome partitioning protein
MTEAEFKFINPNAISLPPVKARTEEETEFTPNMDDLIKSIKAYGVLEPIIVRPKGSGYELVAGSRRLFAAKKALLDKVPVIVKEMGDSEALEAMLIENVHREDLPDVQKGYLLKLLYETAPDKYKTQDDLAKAVGKSKAWISLMIKAYETAQELKKDKKVTKVIDKSEIDTLSEKQLRVISSAPPKERRKVLKKLLKSEEAELPKAKPPSVSEIEEKLKKEKIKEDLSAAISYVHLKVLGENFDKIRGGLAEFLESHKGGDESVWHRLAGEIVLTLQSIPRDAAERVLKEVNERWNARR